MPITNTDFSWNCLKLLCFSKNVSFPDLVRHTAHWLCVCLLPHRLLNVLLLQSNLSEINHQDNEVSKLVLQSRSQALGVFSYYMWCTFKLINLLHILPTERYFESVSYWFTCQDINCFESSEIRHWPKSSPLRINLSLKYFPKMFCYTEQPWARGRRCMFIQESPSDPHDE